MIATKLLPSLLSVSGTYHFVAIQPKHYFEQITRVEVIFNDENSHAKKSL